MSGRLFDPAPTVDSINIEAWDWIGSAWSAVGSSDGVNSATDSAKTVILFSNHVGTAENTGLVKISAVRGSYNIWPGRCPKNQNLCF